MVSATITGPDASLYSLGALPATVAPGATASIPVTITPGTREGVVSATLELISNDSVGRKTSINLSAGIPFSSLRSALIGFYPFDDAGAPLKDESGNGLDLTSVGVDPTFVADGGVEGGGMLYDGSQRLIAPININPTVRPVLTMGAWVRCDNLAPGLRKFLGSDDGGWDRTIGLDNREPGGQPYRYTAFIGNGPPLLGTPEVVSSDQWTFMAVTYNQAANTMTVYVDIDTSTKDDPLFSATAATGFSTGFNTTSVGSLRPDNANEGWFGSMDNVFFYNTVLSDADLTTIRNEGKVAILRNPIRIVSVSKTATSLRIVWSSTEGTSYTVQYSEKITGPFAGIGTVPSQGVSTSFTDTSATRLGKATGFYRVASP